MKNEMTELKKYRFPLCDGSFPNCYYGDLTFTVDGRRVNQRTPVVYFVFSPQTRTNRSSLSY